MNQSNRLRPFIFGQHFADGIRVTLTIILPGLAGALAGNFEEGLAMAVGALCLSVCDAPGPPKHRRNGMIYCLLFVIVIALATGLLNHYTLWMGLLIAVSTFFFSMLNIYGSRAASVGTGALLIMILRMSDRRPAAEVFYDTLFISLGGLWYLAVAMVSHFVRPYRAAQRAVGDCITETARYLEIKAELYDLSKNTEDAYRRLLDQQTVVNDKQTAARELLFKNRAIVRESTFESRLLLVTFVSAVDLFEHIMATWYNYDDLRERYRHTGMLGRVSVLLSKLAQELAEIGEAIHSQTTYAGRIDVIGKLNGIKTDTERTTGKPLDITQRKIIISIRTLNQRIDGITRYFTAKRANFETGLRKQDYLKFVPHQKIDGSLFRSNLIMESSAFRHSLRVMITCTIGFVLARSLFTGHHSYWILMTIIIIMKPAYSLTRERNRDRLTGTVAGGIVGLLLLQFVHNDYVLLAFLAFFALGTYTLVRLNYVAMVIFLTPYVLILFHFLGSNIVNVAGERLLDTAIASALAWLAMNFLFPRWESDSIRSSLAEVIKANIRYIDTLREIVLVRDIPMVSYRLVRKDVFVATANLSAALHRMQSEPKSKQEHRAELYELVVLNHVLSSNIASIADTMLTDYRLLPRQCLQRLSHAMTNLVDTTRLIEPSFVFSPFDAGISLANDGDCDASLNDQFQFIQRISGDIKRIASRIAADAGPQLSTQLQLAN